MPLGNRCLSCIVILALVSAASAQDVSFSKTKYSSVKNPKDIDVTLSVTDSSILIKSNRKKDTEINVAIPYSSIDSMSYEYATRHRVAEGASIMVLSLGAGAIVMATKTKSHWLAIEYKEGDAKQTTVLQLDKSEYQAAISALEAKTGKKVAVLESKTSQLNPTAESKDMDEMVPFGTDKIVSALKPAMESVGCKVTEVKASSVECKRSRGGDERTGYGGEKVVATLDAKGEQTRVRIATHKGSKNWSTSIYQEMMKNLQPQPQS